MSISPMVSTELMTPGMNDTLHTICPVVQVPVCVKVLERPDRMDFIVAMLRIGLCLVYPENSVACRARFMVRSYGVSTIVLLQSQTGQT